MGELVTFSRKWRVLPGDVEVVCCRQFLLIMLGNDRGFYVIPENLVVFVTSVEDDIGTYYIAEIDHREKTAYVRGSDKDDCVQSALLRYFGEFDQPFLHR